MYDEDRRALEAPRLSFLQDTAYRRILYAAFDKTGGSLRFGGCRVQVNLLWSMQEHERSMKCAAVVRFSVAVQTSGRDRCID